VRDPFVDSFEVPVAGGALFVARAGGPPDMADAVVLAVHGITASHLSWRAVARELAERTELCVLAPDLRGRGRSAALPGPYGIAAHVADLEAVLDHAGRERVVLAGHSMGAYVVARLAAEQPQRAAAVVLIDGGLRLPAPPDRDPDEVLEAVVGPAVARLKMTFDSPEDYLEFWRRHPAFAGRWSEDVEAYARADLTGEPGAMRSVVCEPAVRADGRDLLLDEATTTAIERVRAPLRLLRAPRGMLDDENALIPRPALEDFAATYPDARVEEVAGSNHYTITMGSGARAVAAAIEAAARAAVVS
jgi:lipase